MVPQLPDMDFQHKSYRSPLLHPLSDLQALPGATKSKGEQPLHVVQLVLCALCRYLYEVLARVVNADIKVAAEVFLKDDSPYFRRNLANSNKNECHQARPEDERGDASKRPCEGVRLLSHVVRG